METATVIFPPTDFGSNGPAHPTILTPSSTTPTCALIQVQTSHYLSIHSEPVQATNSSDWFFRPIERGQSLCLPHHPQIIALRLNVDYPFNIFESYLPTLEKTLISPAACIILSWGQWRGEDMAIDTWWYGEEESYACMGEASQVKVAEVEHECIRRGGLDKSSESRNTNSLTQTPCELVSWRQNWGNCSRRIPFMVKILQTVLLATILLARPALAVFVNFDNCLSPNMINSNDPQQLQFIPLYVWVTLNSTSNSYGLNITVYGNVTGVATVNTTLPPPNNPSWTNSNDTVGKIPDLGGVPPDQKYTTFTTQFNVLDYTPYNPLPVRFCNTSALTPCPFAPVFNIPRNQ